MDEYRHEAVEVCHHCMGENTVPDWAPEDGVYLGSASIHPDEIIVITEDANKEKHRMQIIKSNIYR